MELITLELRPRLQSCNAFLLMQRSVDLTTVRIKLSDESITLATEDHKIIFLLPTVRLVSTSLSALSIIDNWVCFRIQTKPVESSFGSFKTEVVNLKSSVNNVTETLESYDSLFKTAQCTIVCTCCKNVISETVAFKRVLPFPDIDYDTSDWFCCKEYNSNMATALRSQEFDYFYGPFFSVLHRNIFRNDLNINKKTVTCNRCLSYIGMVYSDNALKLWNCSVDYKLSNHSLVTKSASKPINDFLTAVKNSLHGIFGEEIILESSLNNENHYILIKPMDWNLNLITEPKAITDNGTIPLEQTSVIKVLYRYGTDKTVVTNNCAITKYCEVSLSVVEAGLTYLLSTSRRFPQPYRVAGDYYIGHIQLQKKL